MKKAFVGKLVASVLLSSILLAVPTFADSSNINFTTTGTDTYLGSLHVTMSGKIGVKTVQWTDGGSTSLYPCLDYQLKGTSGTYTIGSVTGTFTSTAVSTTGVSVPVGDYGIWIHNNNSSYTGYGNFFILGNVMQY